MMTKWDTIQEDIKDQYAYLDEVEVEEEEDIFSSVEELSDEELNKSLTLDWDN